MVISRTETVFSHCTLVWLPISELAGQHIPVVILPDGNLSGLATEYSVGLVGRKALATVYAELRSICMLFDYRHSIYPGDSIPEEEIEQFFSLFVAAVWNGTIDLSGADPTGLFWKSRPARQARKIIRSCAQFIEFAARKEKPASLGGLEQIVDQICLRTTQRHDGFAAYSLLSHLKRRSNMRRPWYSFLHGHRSKTRKAIGFPPDKIVELISQTLGNSRATPATKIRDALAWILLAYGGIRSSELFHIWINDVTISGTSARVFIRHPTDFKHKAKGVWITRRVQLADRYGCFPRNLLPPGDRLRAGWKGMSFDYDKSAVVHWINPLAGELFASLHMLWISKLRPSAPDHPYYFVCLNQSGDFGGPWTIAAFREAFRAACRRVDLQQDQTQGICPHGLRHAYGLAAEALGLPSGVIQEMMHHCNPASQEVYKQKSPDQISLEISKANHRIESEDLVLPSCDDQFWKSDPRRLFEGWRYG